MLGSVEALGILKRLNGDLARADIHMVGVVAETIDKGEEMTSAVKDSVAPAADLIGKILVSDRG